jgi:hypothetical protein
MISCRDNTIKLMAPTPCRRLLHTRIAQSDHARPCRQHVTFIVMSTFSINFLFLSLGPGGGPIDNFVFFISMTYKFAVLEVGTYMRQYPKAPVFQTSDYLVARIYLKRPGASNIRMPLCSKFRSVLETLSGKALV